MSSQVQVTFRNIDESQTLKNLILEEAENLNHFYPRLVGCSVLVEKPNRHHKKGNVYHVRVRLNMPGPDVVVGGLMNSHPFHSDPYVAIRDTFHDARRRLVEEAHLLRRDVKHHHSYDSLTA